MPDPSLRAAFLALLHAAAKGLFPHPLPGTLIARLEPGK